MACRRASFVRHICCTWLLLYHSTRAHPAPPKHKNENSVFRVQVYHDVRYKSMIFMPRRERQDPRYQFGWLPPPLIESNGTDSHSIEMKHLPDDITVRQIQRSFSYAFSLWPLPKYRPPDEQREGFVRSSLGRYKNLRFGYSKR